MRCRPLSWRRCTRGDWLDRLILLRQRLLQRDGKHLVHRLHEVHLHRIAQILGNFSQILLVVLRQDDFEKTRTMSGEELFLQSTNGKNLTAQGNFAGHRDVAANWDFAQCARNCSCDSNSGGRAILWNGSLWHVDVNVKRTIEV